MLMTLNKLKHVELLRKCNFQSGMNSPKRKGNIWARVLRDLSTSPDVVCVFDYQGQSYTKYIPKLLEINIFQTNRGEIKTIDFKSLPCKSFHLISIPPGKKGKREREEKKKSWIWCVLSLWMRRQKQAALMPKYSDFFVSIKKKLLVVILFLSRWYWNSLISYIY